MLGQGGPAGTTSTCELGDGKPGDKAGADPGTPADKSRSKSRSPEGRFARGTEPGPGPGPLPGAPNAGRPPSAVREAMRLAAAQRVPVLKTLIAQLSFADRIRLLALDAELCRLPRPFIDALWAGVDAVEARRVLASPFRQQHQVRDRDPQRSGDPL